jgi:phage baseplate assembly protein W
MSELGKTLNELRTQGEWKLNTLAVQKNPIGIKTPLERGSSYGETLFKMHFDITEQIQDNLKNLIMTQKGERLGFPDYGTSLRKIYSNVSITEDQVVDYASSEIKRVVAKFMPSINLTQFYSERASEAEVKLSSQNNLGLEFSRANESVTTTNAKINVLNKDNPNLEKIYKITIEYSIPILNKNKSIILFINNSI